MQRHLDVPAEVAGASEAQELFRAWAADGGLVCALQPDVWEDTATWGLLLADVARHVANANAELRGVEAKVTLAGIRAMFNAELNAPTDEPKGHF
jgi:hypothetical protein